MFFRKTKLIKAQKVEIETLKKEIERLWNIEAKNKNLEKKVRSLKKQVVDLRGYWYGKNRNSSRLIQILYLYNVAEKSESDKQIYEIEVYEKILITKIGVKIEYVST